MIYQTNKQKAQLVVKALRVQFKARKLSSQDKEFYMSGVIKDLV